ncbi:MAG: 2-isopropylmalate synthase [Chloroflexi bacterium]|nr:MAG: 2-isopropylmalate synthase [Chloroflexota bacterium]
MQDSHVRIFDTTLRDGEQAPGCTMSLEEKLEIARQLHRLGVDIIEAGFPAASPGDWAAVHQIAKEVGTSDGPVIAALARAIKEDIDKAWTAIQPAAKKRIHTFLSTSDIHIEHQFKSTRAKMLERAREMVRYARSLCDDIEFSPMDATRSEPAYLYEVLTAVVAEGATTLNIPDTVGFTTSEEYADLIRGILANVVGIEKCIISTHCHDDLGMATANSLAGVRAGARQVECTLNGIGERAGNASLEEVVMALHTRQSFYQANTKINTTELTRSSRLLSSFIGIPVPPNKAIVGGNAFAHESGIHQDGVMKNRLTYEIMSAETVGLDGNMLVLGKHSGRHAFRAKLVAMGYEAESEEEFQAVFERFKELCDRKKKIDDRDIEALIAGEQQRTVEVYKLEHVQVITGTSLTPVATVRLVDQQGQTHLEAAHGTGPVDAIYKAIDKVVGRPVELLEFAINSVTEGIDAVAEVSVRIRDTTAAQQASTKPGIDLYNGYGVHTDTMVAAAEAYMGALNKLLQNREHLIQAEKSAYADGYDSNNPGYAVDSFANTQR